MPANIFFTKSSMSNPTHYQRSPTLLSTILMIGVSISPISIAGTTNPPATISSDIDPELNAPKNAEPTIEEDVSRIQQSTIHHSANGLPNYDVAQLLTNPQLFSYYLNQVITARDLNRLQRLLPHYKQMQGHDPLLVKFSEALLHDLKGENKQSIQIYKSMLATDPNFHPVRLNLAKSLINDKQYKNAKKQLIKLQSEDLPAPILAIVKANLQAIDRREEWKFSASVNYVHDKNINNAPSKKIRSKFGSTVDPIEAHGVHGYISAYKRFNIGDNFYNSLSGNINGNLYWDQDGYNDYTLTGATAIGYMNAKSDIAIKPFITKRIYDDHAYSTKYGVSLTASHWIDPKVRLSAITQYSQEHHDDEKNKVRNSNDYLIGVNGFYSQNASQYFFGGLSHYRSDAKQSPIISYDSNSMYVGWGKEWAKGISSSITARHSQKTYDKPTDNASFYYASVGGEYGSSRKDKTTSFTTELWKRDYDFMGLTPKLVINYSQTNSNFLYYDDKKEFSGTIELSTDF